MTDIESILAQCGPPNERLLAFERVLHLCGDNAALIQAVTAWGALARADERERCTKTISRHARWQGGYEEAVAALALSSLRA